MEGTTHGTTGGATDGLLGSLARGFDGDAARRASLEAALRDGMPGPRSEAWKYTPLRALERRAFAPVPAPAPPAVDAALLAHVPAPRVVFMHGRRLPSLDLLDDLPAGVRVRGMAQAGAVDGAAAERVPPGDAPGPELVFARLNHALADDGALVEVAPGHRIERPLHVVFLGGPTGADVAWHAASRITVGEGASLAVVEHHLGTGPHADLATLSTRVDLAAGARLAHARIQDEAPRASLFTHSHATLARGADYRRVDLELGAGLSRHELHVGLVGQDARLSANGVLLADARRHLDTRLAVEHRARDTACELAWRGLGSGRGRAVFHGGITIHAGADGADANLSNRNLLLSEGAEIDTQPVLVIHADEVQAAHGATVGRLDPAALFYLRSRGLPEDQARRLLVVAFCREVATMEDGGMQAALHDALDRALARLETSP